MEKEKAKEEYQAYKSALETHFVSVQTEAQAEVEVAYRDLMSAYGHLRHGRSLIDLRQAIRETGFRSDGWPRLAIVRADYRQSFCGRNRNGRLLFSGRNRQNRYGQPSPRPEDVVVVDAQDENRPPSFTQARTSAPLIPPKFLPADDLSGYYVLWEAEAWDTVRLRTPRPPRDPFLLARVNQSIFVVLSSWEMTELERKVLAGRIA